jgi:H+-transporting ATPase
MALEKFWAPVPWMLKTAIVLQVALGDYPEAATVAGLLVFNAVPTGRPLMLPTRKAAT